MQSGEYITDRIMPGMLQAVCLEEGIEWSSLSDDWVMRLRRGSRELAVYGYKFSCNDAVASLVSQDKVAAYLVLAAAGISSVPHTLLRSVASQPLNLTFAKEFLTTHGAVVLKPLTGSGARGISKVDSLEVLETTLSFSDEQAWTVSPWLDIVSERRLIILDDEVLLAYEKCDPTMRQGLKLFNLGTGAHAEIIEADAKHVKYAQAAMRAVGLRLAAIDIVTLADGSQKILEVNDGVMMEYFARQSLDYKQKATEIYRRIIMGLLPCNEPA